MLQEDLAHRPENPLLLGRTVETCLDLHLLNRPSNPAQSRRWLEQARLYMRPLRAIPVPAAPELAERVDHPEGLRWVSGTLSSTRFLPGNRFNVPPPRDQGRSSLQQAPSLERPPTVPFATGRPQPVAGSDFAGNAPIPLPYPGGSSLGGEGLRYPGSPGYSEPPSPSRSPVGASPFPDSSGGGSVGPRPPIGEQIASLRRRIEEHPEAVDNVWQLAEALETEAMGFGRRGIQAQDDPRWSPTVTEAGELYLKAARLAPTRSQRATFLSSAARVRELEQDDSGNYALLKRAVEETPYSAQLWQRLRDVSLRLGKIAESQRATAKVQQWTLPEAAL
jgi:hypothetical protein